MFFALCFFSLFLFLISSFFQPKEMWIFVVLGTWGSSVPASRVAPPISPQEPGSFPVPVLSHPGCGGCGPDRLWPIQSAPLTTATSSLHSVTHLLSPHTFHWAYWLRTISAVLQYVCLPNVSVHWLSSSIFRNFPYWGNYPTEAQSSYTMICIPWCILFSTIKNSVLYTLYLFYRNILTQNTCLEKFL